MNVCVSVLYCSAVGEVESTIALSLSEPKKRPSQPSAEALRTRHETRDTRQMVPGRCMGSGNAPWEDVGRELEIQAKGKYSGPGRPARLLIMRRCRVTIASTGANDKHTNGKSNQALVSEDDNVDKSTTRRWGCNNVKLLTLCCASV